MSWRELLTDEPICWPTSSNPEARPASGSILPFEEWLSVHFPHVATRPLGERHRRLWRWFAALEPGVKPPARIEVWPRGGAKSSTGELGIAYAGVKLARRFGLYVSSTQEQADLHVQAIAKLFETLGIERAVNKYGHSRGWKRDQLRTATGFNVAAYGLDGAMRGIKIEQYRPDLIVFDDIDAVGDSPLTVTKKEAAITSSIIPTGSPDVAYLFLQNLIHENSVVSRMVEGESDFLLHRDPPQVETAVLGLQTELVLQESGAKRYFIRGGEATWEGQPIPVCENQINDWGLTAFLREAQHEVKGAGGFVFDTDQMEIVDDAPGLTKVCLAWDLAGTEGGGDYTSAVLMGLAGSGVTYVLQVIRGQWESNTVRRKIMRNAQLVHDRFPRYAIHFPQDPGQAGKDQAGQLRRLLSDYRNVIVEPVSGKKAIRARGWADKVNAGNVKLIRGPWNKDFIDEHRKFREDEEHDYDDQVDAAADAFNELEPPGAAMTSGRIYQHGKSKRNDPAAGSRRPWFERSQEVDEDDDEGEF